MEEKDELLTPQYKRPLSSHNRQWYNLEQTRAAGKLHSSNALPFIFQGLCGIAGNKVLSQQGHLVATRVLAGGKHVVRKEFKQSLITFHCEFKMSFCINGHCCCSYQTVQLWISREIYLNAEYEKRSFRSPTLLLLSKVHLESTAIVYAQSAAAPSYN